MIPCPLHPSPQNLQKEGLKGGFSLSHLAFSLRVQSKPMTVHMLGSASFLRAHRRLRPGDDHFHRLCVLLRNVGVGSVYN